MHELSKGFVIYSSDLHSISIFIHLSLFIIEYVDLSQFHESCSGLTKWLEQHLEGISLFGISPQKATRERQEIKVSFFILVHLFYSLLLLMNSLSSHRQNTGHVYGTTVLVVVYS